jgi:hypothetical protein
MTKNRKKYSPEAYRHKGFRVFVFSYGVKLTGKQDKQSRHKEAVPAGHRR